MYENIERINKTKINDWREGEKLENKYHLKLRKLSYF